MLSQRLSLYSLLNPGAPANAESVSAPLMIQFDQAQTLIASEETDPYYVEFVQALRGDSFSAVLVKGTAFLKEMEAYVLSLELESANEVARLRAVRQWVTVVTTVAVAAMMLLGWLFIRDQGRLLESEQRMIQYLFHEIRNPLNHVVNGIECVLLDTPCLSHEAMEQLKACRQGGELITRLLDDVLNIAKLESGVPLNLSRTCVSDVCANIVRVSGLSATSRGIRCVFVQGPQAGGYYQADSTRLSQILINLLSNSVKYVGDGGLVRLRMDVESRTPRGHQIMFSVEDDGPGVSEKEQESIFMKYRTFHRNSGAGLGLHLTSVIVARMGGKISVKSPVPGSKRGAIFAFTIILSETDESLPPRKPGRCGKLPEALSTISKQSIRLPLALSGVRTGGGGNGGNGDSPLVSMQALKVLVVDDESINVRILVRKLERDPFAAFGWSVETASSLPECLEKATKGPPHYDVLVLDEHFRGDSVTGSNYIATLRAGGVKAPIFMCSANCSRSDEVRYERLGAVGVLPKPIPDGETLLTAFKQGLGYPREAVDGYNMSTLAAAFDG